MKNEKQKLRKTKALGLAILLTLSFSLLSLKAQESINVSGGDISGSGGSMSFSVGQIVYTVKVGTNGSVAEGVHQPYEISIPTENEDNENITLSISVHPNPTSGNLELKIESDKVNDFNYKLIDLTGNILLNEKITAIHTSIEMNHLSAGTYFLKVEERDKNVRTFKIIKRK